MKQIRWF